MLVMALRARVAQQRQVVAAYRARDARIAALLPSMAYAGQSGGAGGGGMPWDGRGFGAASPGGLGGVPWSAPLSGLSRRIGAGHNPPTDRRAREVPTGPGAVAARAALTRQGAPYSWGAKGPNSFDCSGLTQWAWRQAGVQLGSDTYTQVNQGIPVSPGEVRAGDLIFPLDSFGEAGRGGPGHVQLAVSDHEVVHAPAAGDVVRLAPMPSRFLARRPVRSTTQL